MWKSTFGKKKTLLALWRRTHFMMNITLNFPGENSMTLKKWHGIYRVLCCWRGGRFFPVLWASHFSKRLLRAWPVRVRKVCAISMAPSPMTNPNSLKQLRVHSTIFTCAPRGWYCAFLKFSTFHRYHRYALASYPISCVHWRLMVLFYFYFETLTFCCMQWCLYFVYALLD